MIASTDFIRRLPLTEYHGLRAIFRTIPFVAAALLASTAGTATAGANSTVETELARALAGEHRAPAHQARDKYRHPIETLTFFGLRPDMAVVEVWPGSGWYTEVLAPVLRQHGTLVAANFPPDAEPAFRATIGREFEEKLAAEPAVYDTVEVIPFHPPHYTSLGEPASADMVLLSRHFHNFIRGDIVQQVLAASYDVLRPGGILAIVQHRAEPDAVPEQERRTGYVQEQYVMESVKNAGFVLDGSSEVNANPKDVKAYPAGVWTLPPSLRHCRGMEDPAQRAACEDKYLSIGESDRMTLRFIKPE